MVAAARHVTFDPTHTATALVPKWCSVAKEVADCDERDDAAVHRARALSSHACRSVRADVEDRPEPRSSLTGALLVLTLCV